MATPVRAIRVDDDTWARWQARAEADGLSVTDWIRRQADHVCEAVPDPVEQAPVVSRPRDPRPMPKPVIADLAKKQVTPHFKPEKRGR